MKKIAYSLVILLAIACSGNNENDTLPDNNTGTSTSGPWLIPISEVKDGGPGKDGIPSIDDPKFTTVSNAGFLTDDDLVIGIFYDGVAKAYAHSVLNWHEVVNDEIGGKFITINYCPLTGTAFGWESISNGEKSTFGVSGLLYNANLILYDRNTDSNWSQLKLECVNGELIEDKPSLLNVIETDWKTWKALYPNTKVLSTETGFSRNYGNSPYGDYATNHSRFIFTPSILNAALPNKERIYAIINEENSKVYQFSNFTNGKVIKDTFNGTNYLIIGNETLINGFELSSEHASLTFEYDLNGIDNFIKDNEGNKWSVLGEAIQGPRTGEILSGAKSVMSYWFAIAAFYPNPEIYSN